MTFAPLLHGAGGIASMGSLSGAKLAVMPRVVVQHGRRPRGPLGGLGGLGGLACDATGISLFHTYMLPVLYRIPADTKCILAVLVSDRKEN